MGAAPPLVIHYIVKYLFELRSFRVSEKVRDDGPTHEPLNHVLPVLRSHLPYVLLLHLTALVEPVQVEHEERRTIPTDRDILQIQPEYIEQSQQPPNQREQHQRPPEYPRIDRIGLMLVNLTLEFPVFLPLLIKIHPPPQPH